MDLEEGATFTVNNEVVTKISDAAPGVVSFLEQIDMFLGICLATVDLVYVFFSIPICKAHQKWFAFTHQG